MKAGSITFSTALDNEQLEKDLQSLTKKIEKKESEIEELTEKRDQAQKKGVFDAAVLDEEKAKLQEIKDQLTDLRNMSKDKAYSPETREGYDAQIPAVKQEYEDQKTRVNALQKEWNQTESAVERYTSELAEAEAELYRQQEEADGIVLKIKEAEDRASKLWMEIKKAKSEVESLEKNGKWFGDKEYDAAYRKLTLLIEQIKEYKRQLEKTPEQLKKEQDSTQRELNKAMEAAKKETAALEESIRLNKIANEAEIADQSIASLVKRLEELKKRQKDLELAGVGLGYKEYEKNAAEISQITEDLKAHRAEIEQIAKSTGNMKEETKKARKRMDDLWKRLKEILASAFIFNVLSAGLRQFTGWLGKSIKTNEEARQSIAQLKGALLTLAQPLVEIIIPAFTLFVNILTRIITAVAQFVSSLFGKTIKQSKDGAKALYKEANAIVAVGEAADEASGSLAGFDEINTISTENAKGAGGLGGTGDEIMPDFGDFNPGKYKDIIDELMVYLSGALLVIGAILLFSGANIPLGLGLMVLGAAILADEIAENWGAVDGKVRDAVNRMLIILGGALLVIGAILCFTGANIPLGLGLMVVGAAMLAAAVALNWGTMDEELRAALTNTLVILGSFLIVIGAILAFSGANIPLGIGMMIAGAAALATAAKLNWGEMSEELKKTITDIFVFLGISLIVIGAIIAFSGANIALGIGLMIAGAASLAAAAVLDWDYVSSHIKEIVTAITLLLGAGLLVLGAILAFSNANVPLGIGLMVAGAASLATAAALNWDSIATAIQGTVGKVMAIVSGAILVLGIILCFASPATLPLGIALIAAGAAGLVAVTALNWNAILEKIQEMVRNIKNWWDQNVAKYLTLEYWKGLGKDVIDGFLNGLKSAWDGLTSWFSGVWDDLFGNRKVSVDINRSGNFGSGGSGSFGGSRISASAIPPLPASKIPALARGAVIPPNREFLAVLGDQRNGTNLEAPEDLIRQIVREESGGGSAEILQLLQAILNAIKDGHVIMVGESVLGRTTIRAINNITISSGKQMLKI